MRDNEYVTSHPNAPKTISWKGRSAAGFIIDHSREINDDETEYFWPSDTSMKVPLEGSSVSNFAIVIAALNPPGAAFCPGYQDSQVGSVIY